jgi:hypothetical protein
VKVKWNEPFCLDGKWQVQQTFLAKKPSKKSIDLKPKQGNFLQGNIFTGLNKTSLYNTK